MSEENEALVRSAYEAYGQGDMTRLLNLVHRDLEWTYLDPSVENPQPQVCHGRDELAWALGRQADRLGWSSEEISSCGGRQGDGGRPHARRRPASRMAGERPELPGAHAAPGPGRRDAGLPGSGRGSPVHHRGRAEEMRLQILHVPDCPGAEALNGVLAPLLAARPHIQVTRQVVTTEDEAGRLGMTGSPTILADGRDLFPACPAAVPVLPSLPRRARTSGPSTHRRPASGGTYGSGPRVGLGPPPGVLAPVDGPGRGRPLLRNRPAARR